MIAQLGDASCGELGYTVAWDVGVHGSRSVLSELVKVRDVIGYLAIHRQRVDLFHRVENICQ